jgi:hypothetical protein
MVAERDPHGVRPPIEPENGTGDFALAIRCNHVRIELATSRTPQNLARAATWLRDNETHGFRSRHAAQRLRRAIAGGAPGEAPIEYADGIVFQTDCTVDLSGRSAQRPVLEALLRARREDGVGALTDEELFARAWPGTSIATESMRGRIKTTLWELRRSGLRGLIKRSAGRTRIALPDDTRVTLEHEGPGAERERVGLATSEVHWRAWTQQTEAEPENTSSSTPR